MDIKLKNFSTGKTMKRIAFFLCVLFFLGSLTGFAYIYRAVDHTDYGSGIDDVLLYSSYEKSAAFHRNFDEKTNRILYILSEYKGEDYINSGGTITQERLDDAMQSLFYEGAYHQSTYYNGSRETTTITIDGSVVGSNFADRYGDYYAPGVKERFQRDYPDKVGEVKQVLIQEDLQAYYMERRDLDNIQGFTYFATDGQNEITNLPGRKPSVSIVASEKKLSVPTREVETENEPADVQEAAAGEASATNPIQNADWLRVTDSSQNQGEDGQKGLKESDLVKFTDQSAYMIYREGSVMKNPPAPEGFNGSLKNFDKELEKQLDRYYNDELQVCIAYDESFLAAKSAEFTEAKAEILQWVPMTLLCMLASLILLIYLLIFTGERDEEGNLRLSRIDRIFTELQMIAIGILFFGGGAIFFGLLMNTVNYGVAYNDMRYFYSGPLYLNTLLAVVVGFVSASLGLCFILSVVRNVKTGRFLNNSIIWIAALALWKGLKAIYAGSSLMRKVVLITLAVCLVSATVIGAPLVAALILVFAPKWVKKFEAVKNGVREVKNGNLSYKIPAQGDTVLDDLARDINEISRASEVAIQNELKNQRLKTDLISNVSHDLKTPLTSIITYIDLLKKEGFDHPDADKYLDVLDQKSMRLKKLTEDLFEAAKASSGAIPVRFEKVDLLSLINQGLGEMGDRIEASGLEFRINAADERYYVRADGQLLWRVLENLLGNVLKYAQKGSRVYLDLMVREGGRGQNPATILEMKNISKEELNIDADELMERFKRGDESRATEGSGLGLAIAKDLVRLQNGRFDIKIDGDLFKAVVMLEPWTSEMTEEL
ncbi:HAMP domain-containing histidine kinase [Anoxybacterium hadale]|uniref:HAMP domain-containing histidine kinase n=1 Tax=Anoxybacterium hadale TaxID=3408580 RepID=A0ACD1ADB5_9FIRM|nr:HAMP domain-containing histidine kinase [Clostridiales bacterium]